MSVVPALACIKREWGNPQDLIQQLTLCNSPHLHCTAAIVVKGDESWSKSLENI